MTVYIVIFDKAAYKISEKLFSDIAEYIDDNYVDEHIETAEFDCLHDDGILYAEKLREAGAEVTLNETKGTMHGFDIVQNAETTKAALAARIEFMKKVFENDK